MKRPTHSFAPSRGLLNGTSIGWLYAFIQTVKTVNCSKETLLLLRLVQLSLSEVLEVFTGNILAKTTDLPTACSLVSPSYQDHTRRNKLAPCLSSVYPTSELICLEHSLGDISN